MGKKTKVGKQRKDKFYHLAKETGYRSRAAFKLIQLNRKFEFLQSSKVLVDLCAAPGGWMQVAVEHMPVASIIVGVDLFPIRPVAGCIGIQEDITTPRCLALLKKELKTWKADVVLHDGAPNVGQNWIHDAYQQSCLTLSAFKLATDLLRPGGYFITKVFRSKDYNSLIWVLQQFFKGVFSTKPAASRIESAEIFVVCKGYLAPTTIDPKFLDPKYVFEEIDMPEGKKQLQHLLTDIGKKKKADGYPTGENLLYRPINASEFVRSADHIELLANTSQIILDEEWIEKNSKTTTDITEYCKDVKVLGRKEIKALINWRKALNDKLSQYAKLKTENEVGEAKVTEVEDDSDTEIKLEEAIAELKENELKEEKRKRKKMLRERKKISEKTSLDMIIPGDIGPTDTSEDSLFTLKSVKTRTDVENLTVKPEMPEVETEELDDDEEMELFEQKRREKFVRFNKENEILDSSGRFYKKIDSDGEDSGKDSESEEDPDLQSGLGIHENESGLEGEEDFDIDEVAPVNSHPLITDLDYRDKNQKRLKKAQLWFDKDVFQDMDDDVDEDMEITKLAESFVKKGAKVSGYVPENPEKDNKRTQSKSDTEKKSKKRKNDDIEVVSSAEPGQKKKKQKLNVEGLALAAVMVQSKKSKRDLMDGGWNRYAFADNKLPEWFLEDEKKHMKKAVPVPSELVDEYKNSLKEINARPIKKVVEAKARKKKRAIRKLEKTKKRAEAILEKGDMTDTEKANQLKQLYKKATLTKRKEVTYIVAKKFNSGKRMKRPAGLKGPYRVVDPRMKKDLRKMNAAPKGKGKYQGKGTSKGPKGGKGAKGGKTGGHGGKSGKSRGRK